MAKKITRWYPDTCGCVLEYAWDDSVPESQRTCTISKIVQSCPYHTDKLTAEDHYNAVLSENQHKSKVMNHVRKIFPNVEVTWQFDSDRNLEIEVFGLNPEEINKLKESLRSVFPMKTIKVIILERSRIQPIFQMMRHNKPTGEIGSLQVGGGSATYIVHQIPNTKDEIEKWVLDTALNTSKSMGLDLYNLSGPPKKNKVDDIDFTLPTRNGMEYLDLMEVVLFESKGRYYEDAPTSYNAGKMVQKVLEEILKKSRIYGGLVRPVHLLLYSTDWRFFLNNNVLDLLSFRLTRHEHIFLTVRYVYPDSQNKGILQHIFPLQADSFKDFDDNKMANVFVVFGNIRKSQIQPDGTTIIPVQIPWPQDKDP